MNEFCYECQTETEGCEHQKTEAYHAKLRAKAWASVVGSRRTHDPAPPAPVASPDAKARHIASLKREYDRVMWDLDVESFGRDYEARADRWQRKHEIEIELRRLA